MQDATYERNLGKGISWFWYYLVYGIIFYLGGIIALGWGWDLMSGLLTILIWPFALLEMSAFFISDGGFYDGWGNPLTNMQSCLLVVCWYGALLILLGMAIWMQIIRKNRRN